MRLAGNAIGEVSDAGEPIVGDTIVYLLNAGEAPVDFTLSAFVPDPRWECLIDTFDETRAGRVFSGGTTYRMADRSVAVFRLQA